MTVENTPVVVSETPVTQEPAVETKKSKKSKKAAPVPETPASSTDEKKDVKKPTAKQLEILKLLAAADTGLTRKELAARYGVAKGWAAVLGARTKEGFGVQGGGLLGMGLIAVSGNTYVITEDGRKALPQ